MEIVDYAPMQPYVTVRITRKIEVGGKYRITPSMGYAGVEEGIVEIRDIISMSDLDGDDMYDVLLTVESFREAELDGLEGNDYYSALHYLDDSLWIVYFYPDHSSDILVFPLEEFVDHIV